jgi:hypothetical protein
MRACERVACRYLVGSTGAVAARALRQRSGAVPQHSLFGRVQGLELHFLTQLEF